MRKIKTKAVNDNLIFIDTTDKKEIEMKIEMNSDDESLLLNCHESYHELKGDNLRVATSAMSMKVPFLPP